MGTQVLINIIIQCSKNRTSFQKTHQVKSSSIKVETYLMNQNHLRPQCNSQISIPKPDFQDLRTFGSAPPHYYNEFESANQNLHPVWVQQYYFSVTKLLKPINPACN